MAVRMRHMVAWVLCMVYLVGVGGVALSSLLCPCVELHHHSEVCCHDHGHTHPDMHPLQAAHDADFSAPCCDDRHSNRVQLYTVGEDMERTMKSAVRDLPTVLLADLQLTDPALPGVKWEALSERVPRPQPCVVQLKALRAPPVKA